MDKLLEDLKDKFEKLTELANWHEESHYVERVYREETCEDARAIIFDIVAEARKRNLYEEMNVVILKLNEKEVWPQGFLSRH
jgi:hypothetical protein